MYSRILVAYDGSDLSEDVLDVAIDLARCSEESLIEVVTVLDTRQASFLEVNVYESLVASMREHGRQALEQAEQRLEGESIPYRTFLLEGQFPAEAILDHAQREQCDLIIMGSRGLSGAREYLGSVSHAIVHRADIPVFIVK